MEKETEKETEKASEEVKEVKADNSPDIFGSFPELAFDVSDIVDTSLLDFESVF